MRALELVDGYLHHVGRGPVLCPYGQGAGILCCESCAAFRIESHLDTVDDVTVSCEFVHCAAMIHSGRAAAIGRLS